jgi:hypothetical protein
MCDVWRDAWRRSHKGWEYDRGVGAKEEKVEGGGGGKPAASTPATRTRTLKANRRRKDANAIAGREWICMVGRLVEVGEENDNRAVVIAWAKRSDLKVTAAAAAAAGAAAAAAAATLVVVDQQQPQKNVEH